MEEYYETSVDPTKLWTLLKQAVEIQGCHENVIEAYLLLDKEKKETEKWLQEQQESREKSEKRRIKNEELEKKKDKKAVWILQDSYYYHAKGRGKTIEEALVELRNSRERVVEFHNNSFVMPVLTNSLFMTFFSDQEIPGDLKDDYKKYRADCERGYVILKCPEGTNISELPKF